MRKQQSEAILQCETSTKFTREARPRRVGPKRRGRAHESRSRFVNMNDQWTFQCEIQKRHPLRDETTKRPPQTRPTSAAHLGRNRVLAYGPVTFPHSGVSRVSASVRLMIQGHSARRVTSSYMLNLNLNRRSHVYMYAACWHVLLTTYLLTYSYGRCLRGSVVYYCNRILNLGTFVQNGPQIDLQRQPKIFMMMPDVCFWQSARKRFVPLPVLS